MKLTPQTFTYYEWDDIQEFLCDTMGIKNENFRDYHNEVGGDYKDFWHVWITINNDFVANDSYMSCWFDILQDNLIDEDTIKEYGDWITVLLPALEKLQEELGTESFMVHYSW